ncbi:hypothetical protein D0T51_03180 [Parabacteroides sp. 52]|uniref:hypothetical protein n=1 Tax=unclassified Parabacteroides TaxID=2649774 RepID=UPI0013CFFFC3|nr:MULTISPECIES: hypothetical protein [unclassified Parabacteroides]MDH6533997.1 hypothetical protein [Parabacteroides sp. PM5-20]NDV54738.1 hypothetical protein [Parabacteroides sp. 52]
MGNFLSNAFAAQSEKAIQQWVDSFTSKELLKQIENNERQGIDMTVYREALNAKIAAEKKLEQDSRDAIDFSKLDAYKNARSAEFIDRVAKCNGVSDKSKLEPENAHLVYGRVVQAHSNLFKPAVDDHNYAMVVVFARDEAHRYDEEWLAQTVERISEMKDRVINAEEDILDKICRIFNLGDSGLIANFLESRKLKAIPEDCRKFIKNLCNEKSTFCFPLGESLSGGADAWCATNTIINRKEELPLSYIPYNRIIPFLSGQPKAGGGDSLLAAWKKESGLQNIPAVFYTK